MTAPAIVFNYGAWVAMFPEFAAVSQPMAQGYFNRASLFCANDTRNPAFCAGILPTLLDLATAHVAWLSAPRDANGNPASTGQPASSLVGRISNAAEGSVNVAVEWNGSGSPSESYFVQTKYGAEFWQASAQFKTARYSARPTVVAGLNLKHDHSS
jgi:Protein of unknown function (DUF4054)